MILVADSGSSKTDWLLENPGGEAEEFKTDGLNPYFLTEKDIVKIIQSQGQELIKRNYKISEIFFFGAGCSNPDRREIISNALSQVFPKTSYVSVDSDLLGSAYATCGHEKGLCCVLGTGSNISFFNGEDIFEGKQGLGFVLGDEGSGSWFGKALVRDFLYGNMPPDIARAFNERYHIDKETIIKNVYQRPRANSYLAAFARFLNEVRTSDYAQQMLKKGFLEFIDTNIKTYPDYNKYKCHFVGSIAYQFSDELKALCKENGIHVGKIIKKPINELLEFVLKNNQ
ncbi:N-acetylglucosamine kinase [Mucilaginibacter sp. PPCGB 2223]|uniref:N-acetylglucosamine kinase n=1 Tax=Mucilaginibacter sp. PPCGB 2223 TaxID=1886027 RepID=UPI000825402E|nr:N-acetylglucosamine kinase [Mucilaginibacter sp. PPCGB 2223]OCX50830.1 N-acetylglucosamine kinase [Mucilaginibacter sp. PPCGB 2223]